MMKTDETEANRGTAQVTSAAPMGLSLTEGEVAHLVDGTDRRSTLQFAILAFGLSSLALGILSRHGWLPLPPALVNVTVPVATLSFLLVSLWRWPRLSIASALHRRGLSWREATRISFAAHRAVRALKSKAARREKLIKAIVAELNSRGGSTALVFEDATGELMAYARELEKSLASAAVTKEKGAQLTVAPPRES